MTQGPPIIVIDRRINSEKFTSYIGGDNFVIGKEAALFANQLLNGKGKILGIRQGNATTNSRFNLGAYFDASWDITKDFLLNGAMRGEK